MAKTPKARFVTLGKSKFVHIVHTELYDKKHSRCQQVRKFTVAGKVPGGSMSPEAALVLDDCPQCHTHDEAQVLADKNKTPEQRRAEAKDKRDQVMERAAGKRGKPSDMVLTMSGIKRKSDKPSKSSNVTLKTTKQKKVKPEPRPTRQPTRTKAGFRSTGDGYEDRSQGKAMEVVAFAKDNGWPAKAFEDDGAWCVEAKRNGQVIHVWFRDGKYDLSREAEIIVGGWQGKLRGAHAARRQMDSSLSDKDRPFPKPGESRGVRSSSSKSTTAVDKSTDDDNESTLDATAMRPFSLDDPDIEVIDAIKGHVIRWRNGVADIVEEAWVPGRAKGKKRDLITIHTNGKNGRRYVSFLSVQSVNEDGESYGPERNVYLDKILRVM